MDCGKFASLAIQHFQEIGLYYSELSIEKLEDVFLQYIEGIYNERVDRISLLLEIDRKNGNEWSDEKFRKEMASLHEEVALSIQELLISKIAEKKQITNDLD